MTITPKLVVRLFNKLKSQSILYNLNFPNNDQTRANAYCVAYSTKSTKGNNDILYFRRTDNYGWDLITQNRDNHMIFDPKEIQDLFRNCYWAVTIRPEVVRELLRQRREYIPLK